MPRPRTPAAKASATGAADKNPQRHRGRAEPKGVGALGAPSAWLDVWGKRAFERFRKELPWLKESDRVVVEIAASLRGRLMDPDGMLGLQAMQELRRCLAQMGATPADRSKVDVSDGEQEDPEDAFFRPPGSVN
jgi:hypothetical protein